MIWALHGAVGMAEDWAQFDVQGIDLWKFLEDGEISLAEAGRQVASMASDDDILIGYSMGGRIALHALAERKWKKVIIVSAHPGLTEGHQERLDADTLWAQKALGDWDQFLTDWNAQSILPNVQWGDRQKLITRRQEISRSFHCWSLGQQKRIDDFPCPVIWIVGEYDEKFRNLAPINPMIIPNAGHRVPWENQEAFWSVVTSKTNLPF